MSATTSCDRRDAFMASYTNTCSLRDIPAKFKGVSSRSVRALMEQFNVVRDLMVLKGEDISFVDRERDINYEQTRIVLRWVTRMTGAPQERKLLYSETELRQCAKNIFTGKSSAVEAYATFGVPKSSMFRFFKAFRQYIPEYTTVLQLIRAVRGNLITESSIISTCDLVHIPKLGRKPYLTTDEEAIVIATSEMKAQFAAGKDRRMLGRQLNSIITNLDLRANNTVKPESTNRYAKQVLKRVLKNEPDKNGKKKTRRTGEVKVSKLSHQRAKVCDPRLQWIMFHRICKIYREVHSKTK